MKSKPTAKKYGLNRPFRVFVAEKVSELALPSDIMAGLHLNEGDTVELIKTTNGFEIVPVTSASKERGLNDKDYSFIKDRKDVPSDSMEIALEIMDRYDEALRELAK